jgi:hypothetical protein
MRTDAATLAILQVWDKKASLLMYAAFRTINFAKAALYALFVLYDWNKGPPSTSLCYSRASGLD